MPIPAFANDGRFLLAQAKGDLWVLSMSGDAKTRRVVATPGIDTDGRFSPNSRWIAYSSDASGHYEVFIAPFVGAGAPIQVSTKGGLEATWRRDGKEIFYLAPDRTLMAVAFDERDPSHPGVPQPLFEMPTGDLGDARNHYDAAADGQRFLVTEEVRGAGANAIVVMTNWTAAVK